MAESIEHSLTGMELNQTIEMPPKHDIPFAQSSQTVRRSAKTINHSNTEESQLQDLGLRRHIPALDLDRLLADQEYKHRHYLETNQKSQVDKQLGLKKSQSVPWYSDGLLLEAEGQSPQKLPKPSELLRRSRKRSYKQQNTLSKNAMAVEEHVTQLQRKKTNFYGGVQIQRKEETFSPQDVRVHVTRERLQQVPHSFEMVQHSSPTTFWSTNDWLFGQSSSNNLKGVDKSCSPQESPSMTAENHTFDEQSLGTHSPIFEEYEVRNDKFCRNEDLELSYYNSDVRHGQMYPEE